MFLPERFGVADVTSASSEVKNLFDKGVILAHAQQKYDTISADFFWVAYAGKRYCKLYQCNRIRPKYAFINLCTLPLDRGQKVGLINE